MKRILLLIVGIVGGMFLVNSYAIAQTDPANPKLGAAPESDKNIGPGPNDATIGSDKKPTNRRSPASKEKSMAPTRARGKHLKARTNHRHNLVGAQLKPLVVEATS